LLRRSQVAITIEKCYDCPHATNSAKMHDDPFTSTPLNVYWYCCKENGEMKDIENPYTIPEWCPLKEKQ